MYQATMDQVDLTMNQVTEETLVDMANLLAELVEDKFVKEDAEGRFVRQNTSNPDLQKAFNDYAQRKINAEIYDTIKTSGSLRVYITDDKGVVLFDSSGEDTGRDFSRWNDVYLTLKGEYGARATRMDFKVPNTAVVYVAAPLLVDDRILGVVTVAKSTSSFRAYRQIIRQSVVEYSFILVIFILVFVVLISLWLRKSTSKLVSYANNISGSHPHRVASPSFFEPEFTQVGRAMEELRDRLDGKAYIEDYIQSLTHEIKSPVSAVAGALELLKDDLPAEDARLLLGNIQSENERLQEICGKMLELASLEHRQSLTRKSWVNLREVINGQVNLKQLALDEKDICIRTELDNSRIEGDEFLLAQAIDNLLENAIRFSPVGGEIKVVFAEGKFSISDEGPGIPDFAQSRVFDRFYSLPDQTTHRKSTGLGLSFVKQIAELHGALISLENNSPGFSLYMHFLVPE